MSQPSHVVHNASLQNVVVTYLVLFSWWCTCISTFVFCAFHYVVVFHRYVTWTRLSMHPCAVTVIGHLEVTWVRHISCRDRLIMWCMLPDPQLYLPSHCLLENSQRTVVSCQNGAQNGHTSKASGLAFGLISLHQCDFIMLWLKPQSLSYILMLFGSVLSKTFLWM